MLGLMILLFAGGIATDEAKENKIIGRVLLFMILCVAFIIVTIWVV